MSEKEQSRDGFFIRIKLIGIGPMLSLFLAGVTFLTISLNCLCGLYVYQAPYHIWFPYDIRRFAFGYSLPINLWLSIIGVGFSLLFYGLSDAWKTFADLFFARSLSLDEILGSKPSRKCRGWDRHTTGNLIKSIFILLGIVLAFMYKFTLQNVPYRSIKTLSPDQIRTYLPNVGPYHHSSLWPRDASPILTDTYSEYDHKNELFEFDSNVDIINGVKRITMMAHLDCGQWSLGPHNSGRLYTEEVVMAASRLDLRYTANRPMKSFMAAEKPSWVHRVRVNTLNNIWAREPKSAYNIIDNNPYYIVEFGIPSPGRVMIRWAPDFLEWNCGTKSRPCSGKNYEVIRQITYHVEYGVSIVLRTHDVGDKICGVSPRKFGGAFSPVNPPFQAKPFLPSDTKYLHDKVIASLYDSDSSPADVANTLVKVAMALWATKSIDVHLGKIHAPAKYLVDELPSPVTWFDFNGKTPLFSGERSDGVGCYIEGGIIFLILSITAFVVFFIRLGLGPDPRETIYRLERYADECIQNAHKYNTDEEAPVEEDDKETRTAKARKPITSGL
ncbi:hypothetical protein H072_9648 [Dactylellina haptotyla CBS 200.50]|uniref:Uncharacterized protein n=1 Tax=Dactylellina haptotyla (strain CBS 200.50) TaxID=1284197 RepID=S8A6L3_DACHA|nr:hypothetical protein H072_9648 [Dactylellina haptotyla CBS 200.50]